MDAELINTFGPLIAPWATFFAVVMALYGIHILRTYRRMQVYRRMRGISDSTPVSELKTSAQKDSGFQVRWLQPAGELIAPPEDWRKSAIQKQLIMAGYRNPSAVYVFLGTKLLAALILVMLVFVGYVITGNLFQILTIQSILIMTFAAALGFFIPDIELRQSTKRRQLHLSEGFPDALDMLVVCVEAGLGLDAAINRVAKEMHASHKELSIELSLISLEIRAGKSRKEALQGLADRTQVEQVQALTTLLIQAERYGTSVATALRDFSQEMRTERIQLAREKAAKLPVKLIFPVAVFIFPALFLVVLGPAVIQIFSVLPNFF